MTETPRASEEQRAAVSNLVANVLTQLHYPGLTFEATYEGNHWHIRVACLKGVCNETGKEWSWHGRWWRISNFTTKQEVVGTAFKALITALEHEARENFLYRGQPIYDGHLDVDYLADCMTMEDPLDRRAPEVEIVWDESGFSAGCGASPLRA